MSIKPLFAIVCVLFPLRASAQDGVWVRSSSSIPAPTALAKGSVLAVPEDLIDSPRLQEARKAGIRVYIYLDLMRPRTKDSSTMPLEWFEQSRYFAEAPSRQTGLLTLANPAAFEYQRARAERIVKSIDSFDGVLIGSGLVSNASFKYSGSTRQSAVRAIGLDPIDFYDPLEMESDSTRKEAFDMPTPLARFLLAQEVGAAVTLASPLVKRFSERHKGVALVCDPDVLSASVRRRVGLNGVWPALIDLPGITDLWVRSSGNETGSSLRTLSDGLKALQAASYRVSVFGDQAALDSGAGRDKWPTDLGPIQVVVRQP